MRRERLDPSKRSASFTLLAFLLMLVAPGAHAQTGGSVQTGAEPRVSVLFTALGKDKKFVTTLKAEDIRVTADGVPRQVIGLKRQTDVPLFLAVAIDTSASQERVLPNTRLAADVFLKGMMLPGTDKAAVLTFAGDATLEQGMTSDIAKVREAVARAKFVPPAGYISGSGIIIVGTPPPANMRSSASTGMWDAVWLISRDVLSRSLGTGRRALLLITDGVDTSSRLKLEEAVASALQSEVAVYAIGVGDKYFDNVDKSALRKLTERTGGRAFFPKKITELTNIFTQIQEELLSQYVVTFAPAGGARDGSFHKLKIEIANPQLRGQEIQLAFPQGYYAGNTTTSVKQ